MNKIIPIPLDRNIVKGDLCNHTNSSGYFIADTDEKVRIANKLGSKPQQLLILSDELIKEDDWYIDDSDTIRKAITSDEDYWDARKDYKKIIASYSTLEGTPPISQDDIQKWVSLGCPDEIEVETETKIDYRFGIDFSHEEIKTNPNGTIVLKWEEEKQIKRDKCPNCGADETHKIPHLGNQYRCDVCNDYWMLTNAEVVPIEPQPPLNSDSEEMVKNKQSSMTAENFLENKGWFSGEEETEVIESFLNEFASQSNQSLLQELEKEFVELYNLGGINGFAYSKSITILKKHGLKTK